MSQGKLQNEKVEDMTFELPRPKPIRGYPELVWAGKRPFTNTRFYPAQQRESYGEPVKGWMTRIYWGDNLQVMSHLLKGFRGKIDLIYIDPPFDSNADYKKKVVLKKGQSDNDKTQDNIKNDHTSFEESQYSDIWINDTYIQFMYERIVLARELLCNTGSIFIHVDWHKSQYIRCIFDEVFGRNSFINEIIWHYADNFQGNVRGLATNHNNILWYSKSNNYISNPLYVSLDSPKKRDKRIWDKTSKKLVAARDANGNIIYEMYNDKKLDDVWEIGQSSTTKARSNEYSGYPTQKPEALLERIIKLSTNPGSLVLDSFMGSGTAQVVAMKLGRRFIGVDINLGAIETTIKRLIKIINEKDSEHKTLLDVNEPLYLNFQVYNVNQYDMFRNEMEAKDLILEAMEIEPFIDRNVFDGMKDGYKVKIMPPNRIATPEDLNPIISGIDYNELNNRLQETPTKPQDKIMLVCMGHLPGLDIELKKRIGLNYTIEVDVVDILRDDKWGLTFKQEPEADIAIDNGKLIIKQFYPRNLMKKLEDAKINYNDWRELVETVAIDYDYDGKVFNPKPQDVDSPGKNDQVKGEYKLPANHGVVRVKITDLLSESLERTVEG